MRVLVMGTGSVGGYFGSLLQIAGEEVTFVARGAHLEAMRQGGLRIRSARGDLHLEVKVTENPSSMGEFDLIMIAVKSYDTEEAAQIVAGNVGRSTLILSLQNGVENDDLLANRFGWEKIIGGVAYIGASIVEPGVIEHHSAGRLAIGEYPWGAKGAAALVNELQRGVETVLVPDIRAQKWRKLLFNAAFNTVTALTGISFEEATECRDTRELALGIIAEGRKVAKTEGVHLADDVEKEILGLARSLGEAPSSILTDLRRGRRLELDALLGVITRKGNREGISTPFSQTVFALLNHMDSRSVEKRA
jgi:2-dehydropantoate 2-reductase